MKRFIPRLNEADTLIKLLGLLGFDFEGERVNAGRIADQLVRGLGLTWRDIVIPKLSEPKSAPERSAIWREPQSVTEAISVARQHRDLLSEWERKFVFGIRSGRLSRKQRTIIGQIIDKVRDAFERKAA